MKLEPAGPGLFELRGEMPAGFVQVRLQIGAAQAGAGRARIIAQSERGEQSLPLPLQRDGTATAVLQFAERPRAVRLQIDREGPMQEPSLHVRALTRAEAAARLAMPVLLRRLREPWDLPLSALKLVDALRRGGMAAVTERLLRKEQKRSPQAWYAEWIREFDTLTEADRAQIRARGERLQTTFSVLMPVYETPEELLRKAIASVRAQLYPRWELCIADDASQSPHVRRVLEEAAREEPRIKLAFRLQNGHISAASNSALTLASGDFIALLDHDDELSEHALYLLAEELAANPGCDLVYTDEDKFGGEPHFKPDWNPDLLLSQNYIGHLCALRRRRVQQCGGFREGFEGSQDHDLILRAARDARHVPFVAYHWRATEGSTARAADAKSYTTDASVRAVQEQVGGRARVEPGPLPNTCRLRWAIPQPPPLVSLIIPTRDGRALLQNCIESIRRATAYRSYEIIVVDNQSRDADTLRYLSTVDARVLRYDAPFNFSAINNLAVRESRGAVVGLLNNDLEAIEPGWLDEMVAQALRPEIGAVGARLLYPDRTLQHGGVILGIGGVANHAHRFFSESDHGYFSRAQIAQNVSAVTAACMLVRRDTYLRVGGLDEELPVAFNDIDFCLRVRATGLRNLWTPFATLVHHESQTRGPENTPAKRARFRRERDLMFQRWGALLQNDPAYSPNLSLESEDFSLAWPPRARKPWL